MLTQISLKRPTSILINTDHLPRVTNCRISQLMPRYARNLPECLQELFSCQVRRNTIKGIEAIGNCICKQGYDGTERELGETFKIAQVRFGELDRSCKRGQGTCGTMLNHSASWGCGVAAVGMFS